uniref:Uncharacterized protein n=1 Tax=Arundo donax TaxID=35708 RepID=A0A0A9A581_ARUDO
MLAKVSFFERRNLELQLTSTNLVLLNKTYNASIHQHLKCCNPTKSPY